MGFFDLNVPYMEGRRSEKSIANKSSRKNARLKFVVKAMEMGYTGVAYNRLMKGIMSDSDRCTISLFPLSSLLKAAPNLSTSVKFHREILGVPSNSPFRQYTRLTVAVETPRQADALNSGNPVLKSYDLVAVRPLNQLAFDRACKDSEVDIIAIDFSQRLPFRLKLPLVKAAMERGIYFEIVYSHLISDVQARRQLISNAKVRPFIFNLQNFVDCFYGECACEECIKELVFFFIRFRCGNLFYIFG
ncbi:protein GAMETOPHYTE DEFECTIVE 1-like [Macadamia integrifolia]|uniref:protein GAMETOPHYTE DEFECTIVE 1-like n=1 Tax=Macadamia integrifolia TaxID=60698 RepID=UPI001C4F10AD|nr:protein GAMETOPHYTE DEFECTIVE 1-like [Macadamia integrifolia]